MLGHDNPARPHSPAIDVQIFAQASESSNYFLDGRLPPLRPESCWSFALERSVEGRLS